MSAIDSRTANSMREEVVTWMSGANNASPNPPRPFHVGGREGSGSPDEAKNSPRRSSVANSR